jgi:ribonuclease BN (tRNA processing enzyme)
MQFLILGCGTIIPQKNCCHCSGYLIDGRMLIDCGPGIWHALCKEQVDITTLKYILLSHFHVDHAADLAAILATRYMLKAGQYGLLKLIGPPGLISWYKRLKALLGEWVDQLAMEIIQTDNLITVPEYEIKTGKTMHTENSICYRLTDQQGRILFYSGDSGYHDNLIALARAADLAVIEASHCTAASEQGHLTPALAGEIAYRAAVKRLLLTHRYPDVSDTQALTEAQQIFKGEVRLATDGLKIII